MLRCLSLAFFAFLLGSAPAQQLLSVSVTPNPAPLGVPITVTAEDTSGTGLFTPFGCLISGVSAGAPNTPSVALFPCTFLPVAIPNCGSGAPRMQVWNQNTTSGPATPGQYFIQIQHSVGMFGPTTSEWFCVVIEGPSGSPTLVTAGQPTVGQAFTMGINAPANGSASYFTAISGSTNVGVPLGAAGHFCLDIDALFALSFPVPTPGVFVNFQGTLSAGGVANGITINIPNTPTLACFPFHAQALLIDASGTLAPTNDLSLTIQ